MSPSVDETDPLVVLLTWALTWCAGQTGQRIDPRLRRSLPVLAILLAVGARAAVDTAQGQPVDADTVCRALASAGVAVLGHSQVRELAKLWQPALDGETATGGPTAGQTDPDPSEGVDGSSGASEA